MSKKDTGNITYRFDTGYLLSPEGQRFLERKYSTRIAVLEERFGNDLRSRKLLDVGIGYGMFLRAMEKRGMTEIYGMDPFERSIEISREQTSAKLRRGDITDENWPFEEGFFDIITCLDVVEHLEEPEVFFRRAGRYLAEDGIVIVTTPNKELPYLMRSIPLIGLTDENPTHINVRRPGYWKDLAERTGWRIEKAWKGEHLTHIRLVPKVLDLLCRLFRIDHRRIPLVNSFEQSFGMVLMKPR